MNGWQLGELSLDEAVSEDSDGTLLDVLPSQEQGVDERLGKLQLLNLFREKLASFTKTLENGTGHPTQLRVIGMLGDPAIQAEIRDYQGRMRQLEARMIKRLREYLQKEVKDFDQLRS